MDQSKKKFLSNFSYSKLNYSIDSSSRHWSYNNKKKINLFKFENLVNFRRNGLSYGMDDQFYKKKQALLFLESLIKDCGKNFVTKLLEKKNIGNAKKFYKYKNYFFTAHELFLIKFLKKLESNLSFNKLKVICEIGPGYGCLASKVLKKTKAKMILIDLPEANFLSYYFLSKLFPKKKIFVSEDYKHKKLDKKNLKKYDIFILTPWDKFPNLKVDLFINTRSMMEMNFDTIQKYFYLIYKKIKKNGYFLCVNRYYKDTVGYPIELINYPFDEFWKVLISKPSWYQKHIHFLLLKRSAIKNKSLFKEFKKIEKLSNSIRENDPFFWRRILPNKVYYFYKMIKFNLFQK